MSYANPTADDLSFNAEYVELVTLGPASVTDMLDELVRANRASARQHRLQNDEAAADRCDASANAYAHAIGMLALAWDQAMARVARQVTA